MPARRRVRSSSSRAGRRTCPVPNLSPKSRHAYTLHVIDQACHYPADNWLQRPDLELRGLRPVTMLFTDIIRTKRDGGALSQSRSITSSQGLADASIPAEQVSALAMADIPELDEFRGSGTADDGHGTNSGTVLDWSEPRISTARSWTSIPPAASATRCRFLLAPIVAACGGYVPMISGRGLGHTGGTTDKVESIPGYQSTPDFDTVPPGVREVGRLFDHRPDTDLAPADRRFYAIRDVTGTVESIPLITASILSKEDRGRSRQPGHGYQDRDRRVSWISATRRGR